MLAMFCTAVFIGAALLATGSIVHSFACYGPDALRALRTGNTVAETRVIRVRIETLPSTLPLANCPQLRRQPRPKARRIVIRSGMGPTAGSRAAA